MKKIVLLVFVLVLFSTATVWGFIVPIVRHTKGSDGKFVLAGSKTIWVPDNFTSIQEAINNASDGDTIFVRADTYYENVVVNETVSLVGEDKETTVIDGNMSGTVVKVMASGVRISNFTIRNSGNYPWWDSGIKVEKKSRCNITNNLITNNRYGIYLSDSSNSTISGNYVSNNMYGVHLDRSPNSTVSGNVMNDNKYGFGVAGSELSDFMYFIDVSNLVDGKPVYYLINQKDLVINSSAYPDVGYLALVNCSNTVVEGLTLTNNEEGLLLANTDNSTITNNTITNNAIGVIFVNSLNNTVSENNITNNQFGVGLDASPNSIISGNNITNNFFGALFAHSANSTVTKNNITNNSMEGVHLADSSNNSIVGNTFVNCGLFVWDSYDNEVEGNLVNGKPLVYLEGMSDYAVENAGQVILVNCNRIRVETLDLSNATVGVQLLGTNSTKIAGNNITNNQYGVYLSNSPNSTISENCISNNMYGVHPSMSPNSTISENNITNNVFSVWPSGCANSTISGNHISNNKYGVRLFASPNSIISGNNITNNGNASAHEGAGIYLMSDNVVVERNTISNNVEGINLAMAEYNQIWHNNFIENEIQVSLPESPPDRPNVWDNGYPSGGNYWSDYNGTDANQDGIGDTSYIIDSDNQDGYPLMGPISFFNAGTWDEATYYVHTVSNSTVSDFYFNEDEKMISFNVTGTDDTAGFCRVTIPNELLWCDDPEQWQVWVNNTLIEDRKVMEDADYSYIYFTYNQSTQNVEVIGIHVIPEFPTWTSMLLILIVLTVAIAIYKRRPLKTPIH